MADRKHQDDVHDDVAAPTGVGAAPGALNDDDRATALGDPIAGTGTGGNAGSLADTGAGMGDSGNGSNAVDPNVGPGAGIGSVSEPGGSGGRR